jgi:hypothetical protein
VIDDINTLLSGLIEYSSMAFESLLKLVRFAYKHLKSLKKAFPEQQLFGLKVLVRLNGNLLTFSQVDM